MRFRDISIILFIGLITIGIFFYREYVYTGSQLGVPLDDAWIHFRFASNLIQGNGFVYNIGEPVSGSTSPFWVFLLAGVFLLSNDFLVSSKLLSGVFYLASAVAIYMLGLSQGYQRKVAVLAALLTIMAGRFAWASLSGMEVTLFAFLSILAIMKHCDDKSKHRRSILAPILFGTASLVRPEGYALFAFATIDNMIEAAYTENRNAVLTLRNVSFVQIFLYLVIIAPYLLFSFYTTGHFFPQTYYAQSELFGLVKKLAYLKYYVGYLWDDHPILFFFIPFGIIDLFRITFQSGTKKNAHNSLLLLLWTVGYPIVAMLIAPNARHYNRYMMPLTPLYMLLAVSGFYYFLCLTERCVNRVEVVFHPGKYGISIRHISAVSLALVIGVAVFLSVAVWSHRFAGDVQNINSQQVAMGKWVKEHIPDEYTIALSDIGAITYVSGRKRIIDMVGLVNPELIVYLEESKKGHHNALLQFLHREKPDYIITHPNCYPQLVEEQDVLEEIHSIELVRYSGISAGKTMVVYKTNWDNFRVNN
jgi:hypothetical protein